MAAARRKSGLLATLAITFTGGAPLLLAPPLIRGFAASAWVSHFHALPTLPRPRKAAARALVAKADMAIRNLAPLPQASEAAIGALETGERALFQDHDREAALIVFQGVRQTCAEVRSRPFAGPGFAVVEARAAALEESARAGAPK